MKLFETDNSITQYIEDHSSPVDPLLSELFRYTFLNVVNPQMIAGHMQGKFLELISCMIKPEKILEIGTFTGYSAICLTRGLKEYGTLTTIEINDELIKVSMDFFKKAGIDDKVKLINGNALEIIPELDDIFDLVYIDGEKEQYPDFYRLTIEKLKPGGFIVADNVLWDGKVVKDASVNDKKTRGIISFNKIVRDDPRVENILLPLRDGLMIVRKIY